LSWQEELHRLDEELAAGQISADDYRLRRDSVLSSAVNLTPTNTPQPPTTADSTQIIAPIGQPQPPVPGQESSADRTQIVSSSVADGVERPQQPQSGWQSQPQSPQAPAQPGWTGGSSDAERTQYVPGVAPQAVSGGLRPPPGPGGPRSGEFPSQQQPQYQQQAPWNAQNSSAGTPWGGDEFPPAQGSTNYDWVGQGPEVFEASSSKGKKKGLIIGLVIVVVLALGTGGYFLFSGGSDSKQAAPQQTSAPAPPPRPKDDLEIAQLPGTVDQAADFPAFSDVIAKKILTTDENTVLTTAGATKARLNVSTLPSDMGVIVLTVETSSPTAAATARDALDALQVTFGLHPYTGSPTTGVKIEQLAKTGNGRALIRAHYVHKNTVVRVHVEGDDLAAISKTFDEILAAQLQALPVTG
jgi:hypothetical protein